MKYFGFWKEEGYVEMPSILDHVGKSERFSERFEEQLLRYLRLCTFLWDSCSYQYSIIDGRLISQSSGMMSDGKWIFPVGVWEYYKEHKIGFPVEFIQDVKKAYQYPYFILFFKMLRLRRRSGTRKVEQKIVQEDSYPKSSRNGKHFDFNPTTTRYKTSVFFSIPKENVKTEIVLYDLMTIIQTEKWDYTNFLFVVTKIVETQEDIKLRLNTLSLQASFFEKDLNQTFHLFKAYLNENFDQETWMNREIKSAVLEKIEVL